MKLNSLPIDFGIHFQTVLISLKALAQAIFEANFLHNAETLRLIQAAAISQ